MGVVLVKRKLLRWLQLRMRAKKGSAPLIPEVSPPNNDCICLNET